jgi:hypothetical protein
VAEIAAETVKVAVKEAVIAMVKKEIKTVAEVVAIVIINFLKEIPIKKRPK